MAKKPMSHPSAQPDARLRRGRVVSIAGGLCIVLKRQQGRVALVPIRHAPENSHRADVHPSWMDACTLGLSNRDVIRCRAFILPHSAVIPTDAVTPPSLMARIWHAACTELSNQAWEDGHRLEMWG